MMGQAFATVSFAARLKHERRLCGVSQEELAARAGYTSAYISMLERGERTPTTATAELLAAALELEPDTRAEFLRIAKDALAHRRARSSDSEAAVAGAEDLASTGQIVGREGELAALSAIVETTLGGAGRFVALAGEPGIGKTRLLREVARRAAARSALVGLGRCYERQQAVAYAPFTEALGAIAAAMPRALRDEACGRWPLLCRLLPETSPASSAASSVVSSAVSSAEPEDQRSLWWQTLGFLQAVARTQPVVLAFDDLHWADEASLDLLSHLARHSSAAPVLLLGAYRDAELRSRRDLRRVMRDLKRERLLEEFTIPRLSGDETAALAAQELDADVAEELGAQLQRATEGNPFFTLEVLRLLRQRADLEFEEGRWRRHTSGELEAPESVREAISERVERLAPSTQATLEAASVLGQVFASATLRRMSGRAPMDGAEVDGAEIDDALDEAFLAGLITDADARRAGEREAAYSFSHALTQRAIYTAIPTPRRRRLHLAAGEALEAMPHDQRAAEVAAHFLAGDSVARALPYVLEASAQAARLFAWGEVERHAQLAVELARERGDQARVAEAEARLAEALQAQGRFDEALAAFETANAHYRQMGNLDQLAWNSANMARCYCSLGRAEDGLAAFQRLLTSLAAGTNGTPDLPDTPGTLGDSQPGMRSPLAPASAPQGERDERDEQDEREPVSLEALQSQVARVAPLISERSLARVCLSLTVYLYFLERHDAAAVLGEQAVAHARSAADSRTFLRAEAFYGLALVGGGDLPRAATAFEEARAIAEEIGDPEAIFLSAGNLSDIHRLRGAFVLAERGIQIAREAAERSGLPDLAVQAWCSAGLMAFLAGEWDAADQRIARAEEIVQTLAGATPGTLFWAKGIWIHQAMLAQARGQTQQARPLLDQAISEAERDNDQPMLRMANAMLAEEELVRGQPGAACQRLARLLELAEASRVEMTLFMPLVAWSAAEAGDRMRAQTLLDETIAQATQQDNQLARVDALRVQALLAIRWESWDAAERASEESLALARAMPYPYAEAKALYVSGLLLQQRDRQGAAERARARYEQALGILNRLGERLYAERVALAIAPAIE